MLPRSVQDKDQKGFAGKFHFWFNIIMIVLYCFAGILLLLILRFESLPAINTKVIGGVLILYAAYRGYKLYKDYKISPPVDQSHAE
jgi:hypothetical protein